jgi:hypothetical protein
MPAHKPVSFMWVYFMFISCEKSIYEYLVATVQQASIFELGCTAQQ